MHLRPRSHASQAAKRTDCTESELVAPSTAHLLLGFDAFALLLLVISRGWGAVEVNCSQGSSWTITQLNQQRDDLTLHNLLHTSQHLCTMKSRLETECSLHRFVNGDVRVDISLFKTAQKAVQRFGPEFVYDSCVTGATKHTICRTEQQQAQNSREVVHRQSVNARNRRWGQNVRRLQDLNLRASRQ